MSGLRPARAFSLADVLVSIAVIAVLISLLAPSLSGVRETARKVVCGSNVRQQGLALAMYSDSNHGFMPPSANAPRYARDKGHPDKLMTLRFSTGEWDGMGWLYDGGYVSTPGVLFCPSHHGDNPYSKYVDLFTRPTGIIIGNYQFRGEWPDGAEVFDHERPMYSLLTDGMQTQQDYSHRTGANLLKADLCVQWYSDSDSLILRSLPLDLRDSKAGTRVLQAWWALDKVTPEQPYSVDPSNLSQ